MRRRRIHFQMENSQTSLEKCDKTTGSYSDAEKLLSEIREVIGGFPTIRSKISSLTNHRIQVCVIRGKSKVYCLFDFSLASLPAINVKLSLEPFDQTDASITIRDTDLISLTDGTLSSLRAFLSGRVNVRGSFRAARRFLGALDELRTLFGKARSRL
eukprot:524049_1